MGEKFRPETPKIKVPYIEKKPEVHPARKGELPPSIPPVDPSKNTKTRLNDEIQDKSKKPPTEGK